MRTIGLTGGVGSGKTFVCDILRTELSIPVIDSDTLAKQLYEKGEPLYEELCATFGSQILLEDGSIHRPSLAKIVFSDEKKLRILNNMVHPATIHRICELKSEFERAGTNTLIIESAIADKANYSDFCSELWYVYTSLETRIDRLKKSRNYSDEKIQQIMQNQSSNEAFLKICSRIIVNEATTTKDDILRQCRFFLSL